MKSIAINFPRPKKWAQTDNLAAHIDLELGGITDPLQRAEILSELVEALQERYADERSRLEPVLGAGVLNCLAPRMSPS